MVSVVNMILFCPKCGTQHVDEPCGEWLNPPHRSHLCAECGTIWRPSDVPTNGVRACISQGKDDTWVSGDMDLRGSALCVVFSFRMRQNYDALIVELGQDLGV